MVWVRGGGWRVRVKGIGGKRGKHTIGMSHKDSYNGYWPEGCINGGIICGGAGGKEWR